MTAGWTTRQLGSLATVPMTNGIGEAAREGEDHWPRYVRITDIASVERLDPGKRVTMDPVVAAPAMLARGDFVLAAVGATVGTAHLFDEPEAACYAGFLVRFRPNTAAIASRFFLHWTQSQPYWDQIKSGAVQSTIQNFSASKYRSLRIALPPLAEQRAIAAYLDRETAEIDALVTAQEGLIATLRERRAAVIGWHTGRRPAGAGEVRKAKALLRNLSAFSGLMKGQASEVEAEGLCPAYSASGQDVWIPESVARASGPGIVLSAVGARCGKTFLAMHERWGTVANTQSWAVAANCDPRFVQYTLNNESFWEKGGAAQPYVIVAASLNQDVLAPPFDEQRRIADYLDEKTAEIDALIAETERFIALAKERRAALITAAVTGQIDCTHLIEEAS